MRRWLARFAVLGIGVLAAALLTPEGDPPPVANPGYARFAWNDDGLFETLETQFDAASGGGCDEALEGALTRLDQILDEVETSRMAADDARLVTLEMRLFDAAPRFGGCPSRLPELAERVARLRELVKRQSRRWALDERRQRDVLYRLLYGSRAALEELMLASDVEVPPMVAEVAPNEAVPSTTFHGVRLESGDVLLSRGGAPISALIARGNVYPGNFSHVALLHVADDGTATVIESHIESGVGARSVADYLEDKKLRSMVLRLRPDLPAMRERPGLPHDAASAALDGALTHHIPYDFAMDYLDPSAQFCSEVASSAYRSEGVLLYRDLSSMSSPGLARWLTQVGVRHLRTQSPSDLEYDPQMRVVAEWRDPEALFDDHLDGAILDTLLEGADQGDPLPYDYARLPLARLLKGYSVILNAYGEVGPIPEGMTATTGLRIEGLRARHRAMREAVESRVEAYRRTHHRRPPYWSLLELAQAAKVEVDRP